MSIEELDALFDELDDAILAGDPDQVARIMTGRMVTAHPRAADVLVQRLIEGRDRAPGVALMILNDIAGENAPRQLQKIAQAQEAPDLVRLEAQRLYGWSVDNVDERMEFLGTLSDADESLSRLAATVGYSWPSRPFVLDEVLEFLRLLPAERRLSALTRTIEQDGPAAIPLLHVLLHDAEPDVQLAAIDGLERFRFAGSVGPLQRLARTSSNDEVRGRAEAALRSNTFTESEVPYPDEEMAPFPPDDVGLPTQAMLSSVSISGEHSVYVLRQMTDELWTGIVYYMHDRDGFDEAHSLLPNALDGVYHEIQFTAEPESELVAVSPPVARGAFALMVDHMATERRAIPPGIEVWEPYLHDNYPPDDDEPVELPVIDDAAYAGRHDLVARGGELYETDFFFTWYFDDEPTKELMARVELPSVDAWTDSDYRTVLDTLATPELLAALPGRLQRQAYLLGHEEQSEMKDIALAVAASLRGATIDDLVANGFMREMAKISIDSFRNPLGAMAGGGADMDMEDFDPDMLAEAFETLGINPEDLLRSMGLSEDDLPRGRR